MSRIYRRLKECEIEVNGPTDAACKKAEAMVYDALGYNKGFYDQNNNARFSLDHVLAWKEIYQIFGKLMYDWKNNPFPTYKKKLEDFIRKVFEIDTHAYINNNFCFVHGKCKNVFYFYLMGLVTRTTKV